MNGILRLSAPVMGLFLVAGLVVAQPTARLAGQFLTVDGIVAENGAIVKIIGPGAYRYRQDLTPGKPVNINLLDAIEAASKDGEVAFLQPGIYTYEVISRPSGERVVGSFRLGAPPPRVLGAPPQEQLNSLRPAPSPLAASESEYVAVVDTGDDGVTALSLESHNSAFAGLVNKNGILSIRRHNGTIDGDVGSTLVSVSTQPATGQAAFGIGTSVPGTAVDIVGPQPAISLDDTGGGTNWKLGNLGGNFVIASNGGVDSVVVIEGGSPAESLHIGATGVTLSSSRAVKKNIEPAASGALLEQLAELPIFTWSYVGDDSDSLHVGPMSEDLHQRFGFGADETRISPLDTSGLALAGVQALRQELDKRDAEIAELRAAVERLLAENSE